MINGAAAPTQEIENAITELIKLYQNKDEGALKELALDVRTFLSSIPKARAALNSILDAFGDEPETLGARIDTCRVFIDWSQQENSQFVRQQLETRLIALYLAKKMYMEALKLVSKLLLELKRLDDKIVLVQVHLLESKVYHELKNQPKAKAALTAARTNANAVYIPPTLQSTLDLQSGILHAEERDFQTAQSYFLETIEADQPLEAPVATKYLLLCKIMSEKPEEIHALLGRGKGASGGGGPGKWKDNAGVQAMYKIAVSQEHKSLHEFLMVLQQQAEHIKNDVVVGAHINSLYDSMVERDLQRTVLPYSSVELSWIAEQIQLPLSDVEAKLSQMILDRKLHGVLDQGSGLLQIFDSDTQDGTYDAALETVKNMSLAVDALYEKTTAL